MNNLYTGSKHSPSAQVCWGQSGKVSQRRRLYINMMQFIVVDNWPWVFPYLSVSVLFGSGLGQVTCLDNGIVANFMQAETWNAVSDFFLGTLSPPELQACWEIGDHMKQTWIISAEGHCRPAIQLMADTYVSPGQICKAAQLTHREIRNMKCLCWANELWGGLWHSIIVLCGNRSLKHSLSHSPTTCEIVILLPLQI